MAGKRKQPRKRGPKCKVCSGTLYYRKQNGGRGRCVACHKANHQSKRPKTRQPADIKHRAGQFFRTCSVHGPDSSYDKTGRCHKCRRNQEKQWRDRPDNVYSEVRRARRAADHGATGTHTEVELLGILVAQGHHCACCMDALDGNGHRDHIIPLAKDGTDDASNYQWLCMSCNTSKNDLLPAEWAVRERERLNIKPCPANALIGPVSALPVWHVATVGEIPIQIAESCPVNDIALLLGTNAQTVTSITDSAGKSSIITFGMRASRSLFYGWPDAQIAERIVMSL